VSIMREWESCQS